MYCLLSIGVNNSSGNKSLSYAEKDAKDIYDKFTEAGGPVKKENAFLIQGHDATNGNLYNHFVKIINKRPKYFAFFFAGHGSRKGIALSDDLFLYRDLKKLLELINVKNKLVILDVCNAESFLIEDKNVAIGGYLDNYWMNVLGNARNGVHLFFSTGTNRLAGESHELQNGCFTGALLAAMTNGRADISYRKEKYISDLSAFSYACLHMRDVQGIEQTPEKRGLIGDFPMSVSGKFEPIGDAIIYGKPIDDGVALKVLFLARSETINKLKYKIFSVGGKFLFESSEDIIVSGLSYEFSTVLTLEQECIENDPDSYERLEYYGEVYLLWEIQILDSEDKLINSIEDLVLYRL